MIIRPAENKDIDGINSLLLQVLTIHHEGRGDLFKPNARKYTNPELVEILADVKKPVFVAVDEKDRVLGYAFCVFIQHLNNNILTDIKTLYIDDLCVDSAARGTHVGKALYDYVKAYAKAQGCYNLTLNVWACNKEAMGFYEKMGLVPQKIGMETIL